MTDKGMQNKQGQYLTRCEELVDFLPQPVFEANNEGEIVFLNQNGLQLCEYSLQYLKNGIRIEDIFVREDRKRLVKEVHHGLARQIAGPYWRPSGLGDPKLKPWPFDPIKARNLLDKAGWRDRDGDKIRDKDGEPMRIVLMQPVGAHVLKDELKILSAEFGKSGIELVSVPTDWPMMKRCLGRGRFMAAALHWAGRPAEDFSPLFHSAGKKNFGVIANLMLDKLLIQLRVTRRRSERGARSARVEKILHSFQPATFLHGPVEVALVHKRLSNVTLGPDWFDFASMVVKPFSPKTLPSSGDGS